MRSFYTAMLIVAIGGFMALTSARPVQAAAAVPFTSPAPWIDANDSVITKVHGGWRRGRRVRRHFRARRHFRRSWRRHFRRSWHRSWRHRSYRHRYVRRGWRHRSYRHRYVGRRHRARILRAGPYYRSHRSRCYYSRRWQQWVCPRRNSYRYW